MRIVAPTNRAPAASPMSQNKEQMVTAPSVERVMLIMSDGSTCGEGRRLLKWGPLRAPFFTFHHEILSIRHTVTYGRLSWLGFPAKKT